MIKDMESSTFSLGHAPNTPLLQCLHIHKDYGAGHHVLEGAQLQVYKGDTVCVSGEAGCGKTTLVRLLFGLEVPGSGQVTLGGLNPASLNPKEVAAFRRQVSVVFQDLKLIMKSTAHANVALPLFLSGKRKHSIEEKVDRTLRQIGLRHKSSVPCSNLSLGEQQLVAVARATINDPVVLLADEPTAHLGEGDVPKVLALFGELRLRGTTLLMTTKDPRLPPLLSEARFMRLFSGRIVEDRFPHREDD